MHITVSTVLGSLVLSARALHGASWRLRRAQATAQYYYAERAVCMACAALTPSPLSDFGTELLGAVRAVRRASLAAKELQKALTKAKSMSKSDSSPVTIADFSAQALVIEEIRKHFPKDQVVAEETSEVLRQDQQSLQAVMEVVEETTGLEKGSLSDADVCGLLDHGRSPEARNRGRAWVLDPVDGTKGFIRGEQFCVALGFVLDGEPTLGVLGCPNMPSSAEAGPLGGAALGDGAIFFAQRGKGAFVMPLLPSGGINLEEELACAERLHVSEIGTGRESRFCESVEAAHSSHELAKAVMSGLGVQAPPVRIDSQCKYGLLARGQAEIYLRLPQKGYVENAWDHAAGSVVVSEAGGRITDTRGRQLDFETGCLTGSGKLSTEVTGIVVTNGKLHDNVIAQLGACLG